MKNDIKEKVKLFMKKEDIRLAEIEAVKRTTRKSSILIWEGKGDKQKRQK